MVYIIVFLPGPTLLMSSPHVSCMIRSTYSITLTHATVSILPPVVFGRKFAAHVRDFARDLEKILNFPYNACHAKWVRLLVTLKSSGSDQVIGPSPLASQEDVSLPKL